MYVIHVHTCLFYKHAEKDQILTGTLHSIFEFSTITQGVGSISRRLIGSWLSTTQGVRSITRWLSGILSFSISLQCWLFFTRFLRTVYNIKEDADIDFFISSGELLPTRNQEWFPHTPFIYLFEHVYKIFLSVLIQVS